MKITILALALTLLSTQAFAEMRDLHMDKDLGGGCKLKQFVEYQKNNNRYCSLVMTTCTINKDKTKVLGDSDCSLDQRILKDSYDLDKLYDLELLNELLPTQTQ